MHHFPWILWYGSTVIFSEEKLRWLLFLLFIAYSEVFVPHKLHALWPCA
jgi:hypothetical protein